MGSRESPSDGSREEPVRPGLAASSEPSEPADTRPSLAWESSVKFAADGISLGAGFAIGIVTARWLGPAGRGVYATLGFIVMIAASLAPMGLPEAAIVFVRRGTVSFRAAFTVTVLAGSAASVIGALAVLVAGAALLGASATAAVAAVATIPMTMGGIVFGLLSARGMVWEASAISGAATALSAVGIAVLLEVGGGVTGAFVVLGASATVGVIISLFLLGEDVRFSLPFDRSYLSRAWRYGVPVQAAAALISMTGRFDLVVVYRLLNDVSAGQYSVALAVAGLVASVPLALSYASFPRIAEMEEDAAKILAVKVCRLGAAAAVLAGLLMGSVVPWAVPFAFGGQYRLAIVPTVLLLPAAALSSLQWLYARVHAARADPRVMVWSYGTSLATMIAADLALIPLMGLAGAALAAIVAAFTGLVAAGLSRDNRTVSLWECLPHLSDFREVLSSPRRLAP